VERALTLVSAPAGFGKTTALAQWCAQSDMPVAWLSLEAEDNDPTRFLSYLIAALQTLDAQLGTTAIALLRTPQPPSPEIVLALLTNDLADLDAGDFALVLDDYHVITADPLQRGMAFLLEHLPPQVHLVLATRADPPLPLARLRAQGQLCEVRTADLRFGATEASAFLQAVMGLDLQDEAITTLERHTEGWIVGLQLAALSLQGRVDVSGFLVAFSGSHRYVLDYLSDEVLARQDAAVQQFLLHTCILECLSGSLCDAVTGQQGSQTMLEALEKANLFVVAMDDERRWYRYHHLFAQVLRSHLHQTEPMLVSELHRRSSAWHEQHEIPVEAVQHALAAPDIERATRLIEQHALSVAQRGQVYTMLGWLNALPDALVRTRPSLCLIHALGLLFNSQFEEVLSRLHDAERCIHPDTPAEQASSILGPVFVLRARIARYSGDLENAVNLAHQALGLFPETEMTWRPGALLLSVVSTYLLYGEVTSPTERLIAAAIGPVLTAGHLSSYLNGISNLARLYVLQGRLRQAAATYQEATLATPALEGRQVPVSINAAYLFGLGDLLYEWNDLDEAEGHLLQGMNVAKQTLLVDADLVTLGYAALALLLQARDNPTGALNTLDMFTQLAHQRHFAPHLIARGAAVRTQVELAQGNLAAAIHWADASGLSINDEDLRYPREGAYLALARVRIAQAHGDPQSPFLIDVLHLLDRLLRDAEDKERLGSALEILVLRALALEAQGDRTSALFAIERALVLAEPEGYIRLFVDEGAPMLTLLRHARGRGIVPGYVATLLRVFGEQHTSHLPLPSARPGALLEPLTEREREVLRLLLEGASNREIARRLVLSVNTVKRHVYNLCGKLGVQSRTQAIIRARDLNLL
jgi:LuxR family transcriptional regulator, maltose regulon positive regulatory protein